MKAYVHLDGDCLEVYAKDEKTILEVLREYKITAVPALCGGKGTCGKCKVKIVRNDNGGAEKNRIKSNWELACQAKIEDGMHIYAEQEQKPQILERGCGYRYAVDGSAVYAAACDIGTTTVVCHLLDGRNGNVLASVSDENAQKIYGADVISRIRAAEEIGTEKLRNLIVTQVREMLEILCEQSRVQEEIDRLAVVGNTVMCHLFSGLSPVSIGTAPFLPISYLGEHYEGSSLGIPRCKDVYIAPAVAGYVGGDVTADLLAITGGAEEFEDQKEQLLLDIGTNGEIALGVPGDYSCCAAAAGPAFEGAEISNGMSAKDGAIDKVWLEHGHVEISVIGGGEAVGICGSGLIDALAVFLESGLLEENGSMTEEEERARAYGLRMGEQNQENGIWLTEKVWVGQNDIRKLQLAKAAIAAGVEVLLRERGKSYKDIGRVILAGGFGTYLHKESAAVIGLIPRELLSVTEAAGNMAGEGAVSAALSKKAREQLGMIKNSMKYIELSACQSFSEIYVEKMFF